MFNSLIMISFEAVVVRIPEDSKYDRRTLVIRTNRTEKIFIVVFDYCRIYFIRIGSKALTSRCGNNFRPGNFQKPFGIL